MANMTQSAVSAAVSALESRHGVALFDRIGRGVALNPAGEVFLREAKAVLARAGQAENALADLSGLNRGRLRIHASEPAVVAFTTLLRPGRALRVHGRPQKVNRKLIRIKAVVLAFRRAGNLTVVLKLPKSARKNLKRSTDARITARSRA